MKITDKKVIDLARMWAITKEMALDFLTRQPQSDESRLQPMQEPHYEHTSKLKVKTDKKEKSCTLTPVKSSSSPTASA